MTTTSQSTKEKSHLVLHKSKLSIPHLALLPHASEHVFITNLRVLVRMILMFVVLYLSCSTYESLFGIMMLIVFVNVSISLWAQWR